MTPQDPTTQNHPAPDDPKRGRDVSGVIYEAANAVKGMADDMRKKAASERRWQRIKRLFWAAAIVAGIVAYPVMLHRMTAQGTIGNQRTPSVAVIPMHGEIAAGTLVDADHIVPMINKACKDPNVKAIVLDINSPGGSPTESERIVTAMKYCKSQHGNKPIYSLINTLGASAAYLVAIHTDKIYAGKYALVGSIGAIISYFDVSDFVNNLGIHQKIFRSQPLKGGPSMFTKTSAEDAAINQAMVLAMGREFLDDVVAMRGKNLKVDEKDLFSGRIWTAQDALSMGLIDQIAVLEDLKANELKDLKFVKYDQRSAMQRFLSSSQFIRGVVSELATPKIR